MKQKITSLLGVFLLFTLLCGAGLKAQTYSGGSGTETAPYLISSVADLQTLATKVNSGTYYQGQYLKLTTDIAITGEWTPIGDRDFYHQFQGTFDGDNHTITFDNATIKCTKESSGPYRCTQSTGLFGYAYGATIKNFTTAGSWSTEASGAAGIVATAQHTTLSNITNNAAITSTGGVAGIISRAYTNCTIENCTNTASFTNLKGQGAGIARYASASTFSNCHNSGNISQSSECPTQRSCGGIVAEISSSYTALTLIEGCSNSGSVSTQNLSCHAGGIVGLNQGNSSITQSYNTGAISTQDYASAGGITGTNTSYTTSITSCHNTGTVTTNDYQGYGAGILGNTMGKYTIQGCYNTGNITNMYGSYCGGIVARSSVSSSNEPSEITSCFNTGYLSGNAGALVGNEQTSANKAVQITNCYFSEDCGTTKGMAGAPSAFQGSKGESRTEAEMKTPAFLAELDPEGAYFSGVQNGYPIFLQVATLGVENVTANTVTVKGRVVEDFTANSYHFAYKKATDADYTEVAATLSGSDFTANLIALEPSTTYKYYFLARTSTETIYGAEKEFTTACPNQFAGSGTEADPYRIEYACQLNQLAELVNTSSTYRTKHYKLMADLVVAGDYIPIGSSATTSFRGTFDGNGHTIEIQNMAIGIQFAGIFGYVRTATIYNLGATGSWSSDAEYAGGIVGYMHSSTVRGCYNTGDISGTREGNGVKLHVGGIVGYMRQYVSTEPKSELSDCYNEGAISGVVNRSADGSQNHAYIGGISGDVNTNSDVNTCYNTGAISCQMGGTGTTQSNARVGGIAGRVTDNASVMFCSNQGAVSGNATIQTALAFVGGIAGVVETSNRDYNNEPTLQVVACYNTGDISGNAVTGSSVRIGGISGEMFRGKLSSCYNIGSVSGTTNSSNFIGGIVGNPLSTYTLENVYYLNTSVASGNTFGTSRTAEQMQSSDFLAELDPEGEYFSGMQNGYPVLMQVVTDEVENVTANAATLKGHIEEGFTASSYYFAYKKAADTDYTEVAASPSGNDFTADLTALTPNTTYQYYFFASTSGADIVYGAEKEFTTQCNEIIVGDITGVNTICSDAEFTLSVSVTSIGNYGYQWYKDAAPITSATSATLTTSTDAAATYKVEVTDEHACTAEKTHTVAVNANPTITITPITDALCPNIGSQNLTATCAGGQGAYMVEWSGDLTYSNSSVSGATATTTAPIPTNCNATYTVKATVTDENGCKSTDNTSLTIKDEEGPNFTRPADIAICRSADGTTYDATPAHTNGTPTNVADNCTVAGDIVVSKSDAVVDNADGTTTITRTWRATDACGNYTTQDQIITVKAALQSANVTLTCNNMNITMAYGFCDTLIALTQPTITDPNNVLPTGSYTLVCTDAESAEVNAPVRLAPDTYTYTWTLTFEKDGCTSTMTCEQTVTVAYPECGDTYTVTDVDGNTYNTVRQGCECWMKSNLRTTKYSDNTDIPSARAFDGVAMTDPSVATFGLLYSWYSAVRVAENDNEAMPVVSRTAFDRPYVQGACPEGWALPSRADYTALDRLYGEDIKSSDPQTWIDGAAGVDPVSGFDAVAAGFYSAETDRYEERLSTSYYWTWECTPLAPTAEGVGVHYHCEWVKVEQASKKNGYSIRCLKR